MYVIKVYINSEIIGIFSIVIAVINIYINDVIVIIIMLSTRILTE